MDGEQEANHSRKKVTCCLTFFFDSSEDAEKVLASLQVDDSTFIKSTLEGNIVKAEAEAGSIMSLMHTVNDYLSCLCAAEKIIRPLRHQETDGQHLP